MSSARRAAHSYEPLEDGDSPAAPGPPSRDAHSVGAVGAVGLMIGETVGMGVMGLPHAVSRVGIVLGVFMCVFVAAVSAHSALLLAQLNSVYPTATSFSRLVGCVVGDPSGKAVRATTAVIMCWWWSSLVYFLIAATDALKAAFWMRAELCTWECILVVAAVLVVPLQIRTLGALTVCVRSTDRLPNVR